MLSSAMDWYSSMMEVACLLYRLNIKLLSIDGIIYLNRVRLGSLVLVYIIGRLRI